MPGIQLPLVLLVGKVFQRGRLCRGDELRAGEIGGKQFVGIQPLRGHPQIQFQVSLGPAACQRPLQSSDGAACTYIGPAALQGGVPQGDAVVGKGSADIGQFVPKREIGGHDAPAADFQFPGKCPLPEVFRHRFTQAKVYILVLEVLVTQIVRQPHPSHTVTEHPRKQGVARHARIHALQGIQQLFAADGVPDRPAARRCGNLRIPDAEAVHALPHENAAAVAGEGHLRYPHAAIARLGITERILHPERAHKTGIGIHHAQAPHGQAAVQGLFSVRCRQHQPGATDKGTVTENGPKAVDARRQPHRAVLRFGHRTQGQDRMVQEGVESITGCIHRNSAAFQLSPQIRFRKLIQVQLRQPDLPGKGSGQSAAGRNVQTVRKIMHQVTHIGLQVCLQVDERIPAQDIADLSTGLQVHPLHTQAEVFQVGIQAALPVGQGGQVHVDGPLPGNPLERQNRPGNLQPRFHRRKPFSGRMIPPIATGGHGHGRIGLDAFQLREIGSQERHQFRDLAPVDGSISFYICTVRMKHGFSFGMQVQRGHPGLEILQEEGLISVLAGETESPFQLDGNGHPSYRGKGQKSLGGDFESNMVFPLVHPDAVQAQGQGIGRKTAGHKHRIQFQAETARRDVIHDGFPAENEPTHAHGSENGIGRCGEHHHGPAGKRGAQDRYGRQTRPLGFGGILVENIPVGSRGIIPVCENARPVQIGPADTDPPAYERQVVDRCR